MCGIIAVVRRPSHRRPPELAGLLATVERVAAMIPSAGEGGDVAHGDEAAWEKVRIRLEEAGGALAEVDRALRGTPGLVCLTCDPDGRGELDGLAADL
ncbi:MAG TPA: hypothetical protein VGC06_18790, partial [Actinomycetes bacterium]